MVHRVQSSLKVNEHPTRKSLLSILVQMDSTMSSIACSVECAWRKSYWDEDNSWCMKMFILLYIMYSKILLKFDSNEIGL